MEIETLKEYVQTHKEKIKKQYGVEDVTVGYKRKEGILTDQPCIRLWPKTKGKFSKQAAIPEHIDGWTTDVEEEVEVDAYAYTGKYRPMKMGCSIGNSKITAGTLGFVYEKEGRYFGLSNAHVLCEDPFDYISNQNTTVVQPGPAHGGVEKVGDLRYMILLNQVGTTNSIEGGESSELYYSNGDVDFAEVEEGVVAQSMNSADAALTNLVDNDKDLITTDNVVEGFYGPTVAEGIAELGDEITYTSWQADGKTDGVVTDLGKTVIVNYGDGKQAKIIDCILTTKMSGPGSSGSGAMVVRDDERIAVGLNFAGSSQYNVICAIQHINNAFSGKVVTVEEEPPEEYDFHFKLVKDDGSGQYTLYGLVEDMEGTPLPDTLVTLEQITGHEWNLNQTTSSGLTDEYGEITFTKVDSGVYEITAMKTGYKTAGIQIAV